jgi:hypothetical protein
LRPVEPLELEDEQVGPGVVVADRVDVAVVVLDVAHRGSPAASRYRNPPSRPGR